LAALKNGQPAQPVEQIKQTAVVGGDVVALGALRAIWSGRNDFRVWHETDLNGLTMSVIGG
jgi:hypothetical protein